MRILHVLQRYWPAGGGAERHLHEISRRLVRDGHAVTVYTTDAEDFQLFWDPKKARFSHLADIHDGVQIRRFPLRHLPLAKLSFPAVRRAMSHLSELPLDMTPVLPRVGQFTPWAPGLRAALRDAGPVWDVAAGMTITYDALLWPAMEWAARWRRPWLVYPLTHMADTGPGSVRRYYTMQHQLELSRRAAWVFAQTEAERAFLSGRGVAPERIIVAGVGINPAEYGGGDARRAWDSLALAQGTPLVLSLGTASRDKGTMDVVAAMRRLWAADSPAHLVVAGSVQDEFQHLYDTLSPADRARVHLMGYVADAAKQDLLAAASVMCLPSRADSFGIAYLEAWAYGKPVIGARVVGISDVIADGQDGLLVAFGRPDTLAAALGRLLDDRALRDALGQRGRAKVLARYTWEQVYARVRPAYEQPRGGGM
ncbi:MAG: glycosyltransferase family 4 protein [Anaerolineae bacterium]